MKKKSILLLIAYLCVVFAVYLTSSTLTKYVTTVKPTGDYNIGGRLLVNYERGQLYRNNQLIVGVEIDEGQEGADGVVATTRRIETMNVAPQDHLVYHFYVSNYDEKTIIDDNDNEVVQTDDDGNPIIADKNSVDGQFHASATAIVSLPRQQRSYQIPCVVLYREYNFTTKKYGDWRDFPSDMDEDLPIYDSEKVLFEFQVYVVLDEQIETTSNDDYVGATMSILIFVDAADKED